MNYDSDNDDLYLIFLIIMDIMIMYLINTYNWIYNRYNIETCITETNFNLHFLGI